MPALMFGWNGLDTYAGYAFDNVYLKLATNPILLEFLCGVLIGYVYSRKHTTNHKWAWFVFLAAGGSFFTYCYATGYMWGNKPLGWMVPSFFLLLSLVEFDKRYPIKWPNLILYLGTISFSMYLLHNQIYHIVEKVLKRTDLFASASYGLIVVVIASILTFVVSGLSHKYVEIALSTKLRKLLIKARKDPTTYQSQVQGAHS